MPFNRAPADIARSAAESEAPWAWRGLRRAVIFNYGQPFDLVTRQSLPVSGGSPVITQYGRGYNTDFDSPGIDAGTGVVSGSQNRTAAALIRPNNGLVSGHIVGIDDGSPGSNFQRWSFRQDNGNLRIEIQGAGQTTGLSVSAGQWYMVGCVLNGTQFGDHTVYRDLDSEKVSGTDTVNTNSSYELSFGGGRADFGLGGDGTLYLFWDRALSREEWLEFTRDPFAPFRRRRTFVSVSVGGADITGSGSPQAGDATAAGTGERIITGTTTVQAQNATATGTGNRVITDQSSTVQAQPATASGSGTVGDAITGSGSAQAQDATATATGEREITALGSPQAQAATATGVGERIITGTAAVQADPANASGTDTEEAFKAKLQPGVGYSRLYSYIKG